MLCTFLAKDLVEYEAYELQQWPESPPEESGGREAAEPGEATEDGSPSYVMSGYKRWNRIYYSDPGKPQGVVMLLISKARKQKADLHWTTVDPLGRVQVVDLKDKTRVSARPRAGVSYDEGQGLGSKEQDRIVMVSDRLIVRADMGSAPKMVRNQSSSKATRTKKKSQAVRWAVDGVSAIALCGWAKRHWGPRQASHLWPGASDTSAASWSGCVGSTLGMRR